MQVVTGQRGFVNLVVHGFIRSKVLSNQVVYVADVLVFGKQNVPSMEIIYEKRQV